MGGTARGVATFVLLACLSTSASAGLKGKTLVAEWSLQACSNNAAVQNALGGRCKDLVRHSRMNVYFGEGHVYDYTRAASGQIGAYGPGSNQFSLSGSGAMLHTNRGKGLRISVRGAACDLRFVGDTAVMYSIVTVHSCRVLNGNVGK